MLENYRKLFVEKEHIMTELRKLTSLSSIKTPPPPPPASRRMTSSHSSGHTCKPPGYSGYQEPKMESRYLKNFYGGYVERDGVGEIMEQSESHVIGQCFCGQNDVRRKEVFRTKMFSISDQVEKLKNFRNTIKSYSSRCCCLVVL